MKNIKYLERVDLSHNQLNGTVPAWLGTLERIKILNLSYNGFSGEVPRNGKFVNFASDSFLGNFGLCGGSMHPLPSCKIQRKRSNIRKIILYTILAVVLGLTVFLAVIFSIWHCFFKKRFKKKDSIMLRDFSISITDSTMCYTRRELEVATDGFIDENLLGRGSFGSVYKAALNRGSTIVAVKVFHEESSQSLKSLKRECEIFSQTKHRNLVKVLGSSWSNEFKALVLEFIPNGNLEQHLYPSGVEEGPCKLTLEARMSIAVDIANGLEYLQEGCPTQIVHCDLKPENVLIDYDMVARITDFGIGKLLFEKTRDQTNSTAFLRGSIGYIPPEYAQGLEVSARGDTYSFGIMLLEMITRKRPTSGMFSADLSLRKWVVSSFPSNISEIIDPTLKRMARFEDSNERLEKCCSQVLRLALMCTEPSPHERPVMSLAVQMLLSISRDLSAQEKQESEEVNKIAEEEMSILVEFT